MITDRSEKYPSKQDMSLKMDELFGLSLNAKTSSFGEAHTLEIRIKTLNERYTDFPHLKDSAAFLFSCINNPLLNEITFKEAKINLDATLRRIEDKPSYLGILRACEGIGKGTTLSVFSQGNKEVLKTLTLDDVLSFHKRLIETIEPTILMMGDISSKTKNDLLQILTFSKNNIKVNSIYRFEPKHNFRANIDKQFDQSTLTQLYTTNVLYGDELYFPMRIMIIMLGQLPNSLLFQEVREKRSLCYSISAGSFNFDGIMSIQTGIEHTKKEIVETLIEEQIIKLKKGKFSKRLLDIAKKMFVNGLESMEDDQNAYLNYLYQRSYTNKDFDLSKSIQLIKKISREEIIQVANQLSLVSEYMIRGKN
jgi:predicted Zn-dependent peptidase